MHDAAAVSELIAKADLVTPMAIRAATQLRVLDVVADDACDAQEVAARTGTQPRAMRKLLEHLVHVGLVEHEHPDRFRAGPLSQPLLSENAALGLRGFLDPTHVVGRQEMALTDLVHTLRTGRPAIEAATGSVWEQIDAQSGDLSGLESFDWEEPGFDASAVLEDPVWSGVRTVADVGGNSGSMLLALLSRHQHLRGQLLDLRVFADRARARFAAAGLADRAEALAGDFLRAVPTGAEVYLLSAILADWDDEDATQIIRRCLLAGPAHGVVLVAEVHMAPQGIGAHATASALRLEAGMTRPDRTPADIRSLAEAAGGAVERHRVVGARSITVVRSAQGAR